jgi:hypothetical protein
MPSETARIPGGGPVVMDQRRNWSSSTVHTDESTLVLLIEATPQQISREREAPLQIRLSPDKGRVLSSPR